MGGERLGAPHIGECTMKKTISILLIFITLTLSSCGSWSVDDVSTPVSGTEELVNGNEYLGAVDFGTEYKTYSKIFHDTDLVPGAGVFLFRLNNNGDLISYDPLHDRASYFCFDPACTHPLDGGCIAKTLKVSPVFTYYDGYFYFAYIPVTVEQDSESGIARVSPDGTEMKVLRKMNGMGITHLKAGGGYLYILRMGQKGVDRYNLETGEYVKLDQGQDGMAYNGFIVTENGVVLHGGEYVWLADHDLQNKTPIFKGSVVFYTEDKIYHFSSERASDGETIKATHFYEYDMKTGEDKCFYTEKQGTGGVHCADENYLYYSPKTHTGSMQYITGGVINRVNITTGESEKIFEDSRLEIEEMYSIDGKLYVRMINVGSYKGWMPGGLQGANRPIFGKLVDEDGDGMFEFEPFVWDVSYRFSTSNMK